MRASRVIARALRRLAKLLVTLFGTSPRQARRVVAVASQAYRRALHASNVAPTARGGGAGFAGFSGVCGGEFGPIMPESPVVTVERIGTELAQQLLVTGERASAAFNAMCVRMRRRVVTGGYPRA